MRSLRSASIQTCFVAGCLLAALASCSPSPSSGGGGGGTGTGGSGGGSGSSGGGAGGSNPSSGFWFEGSSESFAGVTIGFAYNTAQFPGQGASYIQPDAGQGEHLLLPVHESLMEAAGGLSGSASLDATQSGNTLTIVMQATATSATNDQASSAGAGISDEYSVCFAASAGAKVDFAINCSGPVGTTGSNGIITAAVNASAANPPCSNGVLLNEGTLILNTGWSPDGGSFAVTNVSVSNGAACTNLGGFSLNTEGGEINGTGATGSATADVTFTVTATAH